MHELQRLESEYNTFDVIEIYIQCKMCLYLRTYPAIQLAIRHVKPVCVSGYMLHL